uniref:Uncharacterized protein n=1 Tax=Glossina pallidipes TaxID=7398 RepID=A0A1A9Z9B4_GLOPL
ACGYCSGNGYVWLKLYTESVSRKRSKGQFCIIKYNKFIVFQNVCKPSLLIYRKGKGKSNYWMEDSKLCHLSYATSMKRNVLNMPLGLQLQTLRTTDSTKNA